MWKIYARRSDYGRGVELFIKRGDISVHGTQQVVTALTITGHPEDSIAPPSPVDPREGEDFLRAAMNCAWELGLRPDGFEDTRESMAATKAHLQDMRAIAFHQAGAPKP